MAFSPVTGPSSGDGQEHAKLGPDPGSTFNLPRQESQPDPLPVLTSLHDAVRAGEHTVNAILEAVTEAAQVLTRAHGAAIALRHEAEVVCRARCGDPAPEIGSRLSVDSGLSGECLRTGNSMRCDDTERDYRVDPEVCRALGLRSIAAVPIRGRRGVMGILEVFSTRVYAFDPGHVELLERLAKLAADSHPDETRPAPPPELKLSRWREAGDVGMAALLHARDSARSLAVSSARGRRGLVLGILIAVLVAGLAIAKFWWRPPAVPVTSAAASSSAALQPQVSQQTAFASGDLNWNASGSSAPPVKPSPAPAGVAIQRAASVAKEPSTARSATDAKQALGAPWTIGRDSSVSRATSPAVPPGTGQDPRVDARATARAPAAAPASLEPPVLSPRTGNEVTVANMIAAPANVPRFSSPVSQGIQDGAVIHRVQPVYPVEALPLRLEGTVTLEAIITVSGSLSGLKVVSGHPILAKAAINAVRQWRYRPYQLNGKPVPMATRISVSFKPE